MKKKIPECRDFYTEILFKQHKWIESECECPHCPVGSHKMCDRCYEIK